METFKINRAFGWQGTITNRMGQVLRFFGMNRKTLRAQVFSVSCDFQMKPGQICCITGSSGTGKTLLLNELYSNLPADQCIRLEEIPLRQNHSLVDSMEGDLMWALDLLSRVGLSDAYSLFCRSCKLSEGQKYRYRLARALISKRCYVFADEFCSCLDRITARVISHQLRQYASRTGNLFFVATAHEDILADLLPDVLIVRQSDQSSRVVYRN